MTYKLYFIQKARKEWNQLDTSTQEQFKKKIAERLKHPHILKDRLATKEQFYKIKLRNLGYRLVYEVIDQQFVVKVIVIAKRDKSYVYKLMRKRVEI
ncbi:MAG: type II toxin-antitoxin system RelE/ParE family toxin [Alphaproteobacteria bacterium]|nr:MAG: type II toxin-antitoxin system RelE/ParE family toxin [Alphaproteobacteria bacterium]